MVDETVGESDMVSMSATDIETADSQKTRQIEGRFPTWREAIPAYSPRKSVSVTLDASYLIQAAQLLQKHTGSAESRSP